MISINGFGENIIVSEDREIIYDAGLSDSKLVILTIPLEQEVYQTNEQLPIIGTKAVRLNQTTHPITGFEFDRKRWVDDDDRRSRNKGFIGSLLPLITEGAKEAFYLSGIGSGDDCEFLDLWREDDCEWNPKIFHGDYFSYYQNYYLFSDDSVTHPLVENFVEFDPDTQSITLQYQPKGDVPLLATIFRRGRNLEAVPYRQAERVSEFTGIIDGDTREDPVNDDGDIDYDLVETFHTYELMYDGDTKALRFNRNFSFSIGPNDTDLISNGTVFPTTDSVALEAVSLRAEQLGVSDGLPNQFYFSRFFPIDPTETAGKNIANVYMWDSSNVYKWSKANDNNLANHSSTEQMFQIDYDLGIIRFAISSDETTRVTTAITIASSSIVVDNAKGFPQRGRLLIGSEVIQYDTRDETTFYNLTRSSPVAHAIGAEVTFSQCGRTPPMGARVALTYATTPRIEYEPDEWRDFTIGSETNVHPIHNPKSNGIVYISRKPLELESLTLTVDKRSLGDGIYGPLFIGSDYALLKATALAVGGEPISGLRITIEQLGDTFLGLLGGSANDYSSISNQDGEISSVYTSGGDLSLVGSYTTFSSVSATQKKLTIVGKKLYNLDLDKTLVFAVTKDDPSIGTVGAVCDATYSAGSNLPSALSRLSSNTVISNSLATTIDLNTRYPDGYFDNGTVFVLDGAGTIHEATVLYWRGNQAHLDQTLTLVGGINYVRYIAPDWTEWNATSLNGKRRVIYEYDSGATHPLTGNLGAYYPILASSYEVSGDDTILTYDFSLPEPDATDNEENLGSYWVSSDNIVSFRAYADSPLTGRRIYSNTVSIRLSLPDYLSGVYLSGSSRKPYGWRLREDLGDPSSGLGGSTFVTINPISGGYGATVNPFGSMLFMLST